MALLYAMAGATTGERGFPLLQCAETYLSQVKQQTGVAEEPSKDWSRLQLAVLNNQAFISNELGQHNEAKMLLHEMGTHLHLSASVLDINVWQEFTLNFQCLKRTSHFAAAA